MCVCVCVSVCARVCSCVLMYVGHLGYLQAAKRAAFLKDVELVVEDRARNCVRADAYLRFTLIPFNM